MRSVVVSNLVSLDGYMAGPNGEIDWFTGVVDREIDAYSAELIDTVDTMLFGRITYELMASYWPEAKPDADDPRIIAAMNETPKVVFSRTLRDVGWKNTRLVRGDASPEVARLKALAGKSIVIYGSGGLVNELARDGLIDEYRILVAPIALGAGKPLFGHLDRRLALEHTETRTFGNGTVLLRYRPRHGGT